MQIGMIGLGRMGADIVHRLLQSGHECVVFDMKAEAVKTVRSEGALGARSLEDFASRLVKPRIVWLMVSAAITDFLICTLTPLLDQDDIVVEGGNSKYLYYVRRSKQF